MGLTMGENYTSRDDDAVSGKLRQMPITPIPVMSKDWFSTISFGDIVKMVVLLTGMFGAFVRLEAKVDKEAELRAAFEARTLELTTQIRETEIGSIHAVHDRLAENAAITRETTSNLRDAIIRLGQKVDALIMTKMAK